MTKSSSKLRSELAALESEREAVQVKELALGQRLDTLALEADHSEYNEVAGEVAALDTEAERLERRGRMLRTMLSEAQLSEAADARHEAEAQIGTARVRGAALCAELEGHVKAAALVYRTLLELHKNTTPACKLLGQMRGLWAFRNSVFEELVSNAMNDAATAAGFHVSWPGPFRGPHSDQSLAEKLGLEVAV